MRETAATWAKRVRDWKASGETSERFSAARGFSAMGLRNWAHRLGQTKARKPRADPLRIVRVDRVATAEPVVPVAPMGVRLEIEIGDARVAVAPGFDVATLAAIVDVLEGRMRSAR